MIEQDAKDAIADHRQRVEGLQETLRDREWRTALIMQPRDLYYYAGTAQPANLWVPRRGDPILFTRRAHQMAREATWIEHTVDAGGFGELHDTLAELGSVPSSGDVIGVEQDVVPHRMLERLKQEFVGVELGNVSPLILRQRLIKTNGEVRRIREAVELWKRSHQAIMEAAAPGVREHEVAAAMEHAARSAGGTARSGSVGGTLTFPPGASSPPVPTPGKFLGRP